MDPTSGVKHPTVLYTFQQDQGDINMAEAATPTQKKRELDGQPLWTVGMYLPASSKRTHNSEYHERCVLSMYVCMYVWVGAARRSMRVLFVVTQISSNILSI